MRFPRPYLEQFMAQLVLHRAYPYV